jgi:hypothetical protein
VLSWFEQRFGVDRQTIEVLDSETFKRWISDDEAYRVWLRERISRKNSE